MAKKTTTQGAASAPPQKGQHYFTTPRVIEVERAGKNGSGR